MSDLGRDARDLLATARGAHDAAPGAKERVRVGVVAALSASAGVGATLPHAIARGPWTLAAKGIVVMAIVGAGAGIFLGQTKSAREQANAPPSAPTVAVAPPEPPSPPTVATTPEPAASSLSPPLPLPKAEAKTATGSGSRAEGSVAAEVAILRRVSAALRAGDPATALAAVGEHARRFPNGALAEERDTERIVALCALGRRDEAARATQRFDRAYPSSSHASTIHAACAPPAPSSGVAP